jgi:hypothetical protein
MGASGQSRPFNERTRGKIKMKISLVVACAAACFATGPVVADEDANESMPIELSAVQMDKITAGSLGLPNGNVVQSNFDNPAPNVDGYLAEMLGLCDTDTGAFCHPAITRRSDAAFVTGGDSPSPSVTGEGNDGPWTATVVSPVIDFVP